MNFNERKACYWLMSVKNIEPENIKWNSGKSPDYICNNTLGFEIKTIHNHCIIIYNEQYPDLLKYNSIILAYDNKILLPIAIIPIKDISMDNLKFNGIKVKFVNHTYTYKPLINCLDTIFPLR